VYRFNLGISCINLKRYDEAIHHILTALRLQQADSIENPDPLREGSASTAKGGSEALWDTYVPPPPHPLISALSFLLPCSVSCKERAGVTQAKLPFRFGFGWDALRLKNACTYIHRPDLVELAEKRDLTAFDGVDDEQIQQMMRMMMGQE
jgi:hypothetical protein